MKQLTQRFLLAAGNVSKTAGGKVRKWESGMGRPTSPHSLTLSLSHRLTFSLALLLVAGAAPDAGAQVLPLEIRQDDIHYNLRKTNGLPISTVANVPPGSDGRGPTLAQQQAAGLTEVAATANQFRGFVVFGASVRPISTLLNPNLSLAGNAENLKLPRGKQGTEVIVVLLRGRIAAPYHGRSFSYDFGDIVARPATDEYGVLLSTVNTNAVPNRPVTAPEDYWLPEPYTTTSHTDANYYWSPHAQKVFAVNAGPLAVPWRRSVSSTIVNPPVGVGTVIVPEGLPYVVATNQYIISGSPVKRPRQMYWTERSFADTGKPVSVPGARVGAVNIVYNSSFPNREESEIVIPGSSPIVTSNMLQETRTLWYDDSGGQAGGQIRAYNREGRVFMELLGDVNGLNTRQHLGFEIVDVVRQPAPNDVTIELGEKLTSYPDDTPSDAGLFPEPLLLVGQSFTFQHNPSGSARPTYHATRETANQNDLQFHWLEEGLEGLKWPYRFVRYQLVWPDDVAKYSHYVRAVVATEEEAKATAVPLPSQNAPFLAYQDPLDQPRGKLTENFAYYSWLTPEYPAHRALLRFSSGDFLRFERVFSWLDENLKTTNFTGTVAANLKTVADYPSAQTNYASYLVASNAYQIAYTNYLTALANYPAALTRGVNNVWELQLSTDVGAVASMTSWAMVVETATPGTAFRFTNEFAGTGLTIPDEGGGFSPVTVSGITNAVTAIWIKLNGLMSTRPEITEVWLGRLPTTFAPIMGLQGGTVAVTNLNLVFDDRAAAQIGGSLASGAYRPRSILANMLLPAPTHRSGRERFRQSAARP
jgi:hypothetical protein